MPRESLRVTHHRRETIARQRRNRNIAKAIGAAVLVGTVAIGCAIYNRYSHDSTPNNPVPITESAGRIGGPASLSTEAIRLNPSLETNYGPFQVTVEGADQIGRERAREAIEAAHLWHSVYSCNRPIVIAPLLDPQEKEDKPGVIGETIERAQPGKIFIGPRGNARNLTLHAMTHACIPDSPTYLQQPLPVEGGFIIGYHGLKILISESGSGIRRFIFIDEGMAERNASVFPGYNLNIKIPGFEVQTTYYSNVGKMTGNTISLEEYPNAHEWPKANNVPAFVRNYLHVPNNQNVTLGNLVNTMNRYTVAWERGGGS